MPSISTSSLAVCKWLQCRDSFNTQDRLVQHVLDAHIAKATPIKRKELPSKKSTNDGSNYQDTIHISLLLDDIDSVFLSRDEKDSVLDASYANPDRSAAHDVFAPQTPQRQLAASPSPGPNRFSVLSSAATRSPDPDTMLVGASPSSADLLASIINRVSNQQNGLSSIQQYHLQSQWDYSRKRSLSSPDSDSRRKMRIGLPPSPKSQRPGSENTTNTVDPVHLHSPLQTNALSQSQNEPETLQSFPRSRSQSQSQVLASRPSQARPFRIGSVRLEPSSQSAPSASGLQSRPELQTERHTNFLQNLPNMPARVPPYGLPQPSAPIYVQDTDTLSSSLEPSLPIFSQTQDQTESQLQLQTQAPYAFDSQLSSDSQTQSQPF